MFYKLKGALALVHDVKASNNQTAEKILAHWHKYRRFGDKYLWWIKHQTRVFVVAVLLGIVPGLGLNYYFLGSHISTGQVVVIVLLSLVIGSMLAATLMSDRLVDPQNKFNRRYVAICQRLDLKTEEFLQLSHQELFDRYEKHLKTFSAEVKLAETDSTTVIARHELPSHVNAHQWARVRFSDEFDLGYPFGLTYESWKPYFQ